MNSMFLIYATRMCFFNLEAIFPLVVGVSPKLKSQTPPTKMTRRVSAPPLHFHNASPLPIQIQKSMLKHNIYPRATTEQQDPSPVPLAHLSYFNYTNASGQKFEMVIHKEVYEDCKHIFHQLIENSQDSTSSNTSKLGNFILERMELIDEYQGDDLRSMQANNSSAFNVRPITGKVGMFSKHSYGLAIDINPLYNPYRNGDLILPSEGKLHLDEYHCLSPEDKQQIVRSAESSPSVYYISDQVANLFKERGFDWGGDWKGIKQDYHHFEIIPTNYYFSIQWNLSSMQEYDAWFQRHIQKDCKSVLDSTDRGTYPSDPVIAMDGTILRPLHITIETERLVLSSVTEEDLDEFANLFSNEAVMKQFAGGVRSRKYMESRLKTWTDRWRAHDPYSAFSIRLKKKNSDNDSVKGEFIGHVVLGYSNDNNSSELAYSIHERYWNQGYGSEAVGFMCNEYARWLQSFYGLHSSRYSLQRIVATAHDSNAASVKLLVKNGFQQVQKSSASSNDSNNETCVEDGESEGRRCFYSRDVYISMTTKQSH